MVVFKLIILIIQVVEKTLMAVQPLLILLEILPVVPQQMEIKLFGMLMELLQKFLLQILQKIAEVPMI